MANITPYHQKISPSAVGGPTPNAQGAPIYDSSSVIKGVGQAVADVVSVFKKREDEQGRAWSAEALSKARLDLSSEFARQQSEAGPGAPDFTNNVVKGFDEYSTKLIESAPTPAARQHLHERLYELRSSIGDRAITFEAAARIDYRDTAFNNAIDNTQKLMTADPSQFKSALAEQLATIDGSAIPPKQKADLRQKAITNISSSAVDAAIKSNPQQFLDQIGLAQQKYGRQSGVGEGTLVSGRTGNDAFDLLPSDTRIKKVTEAIALQHTLTQDAERKLKEEHKEIGQDLLKEAFARLTPQKGQPRLDRTYIEQVRPFVSAAEYKSLLEAYNTGQSGGETKTDPRTFRQLQTLLYTDPQEAEKAALQAHRGGLISNSDLSSTLTKANSLDRQGGPKSEYERTSKRIAQNLDPGPLVQDPAGKSRYAEAIYEFDEWSRAGKRTDAEVQKRGEEIINQYRFINLSQTAAVLPQPRFGGVRRGGDGPSIENDIRVSIAATVKARDENRLTPTEYTTEMKRLNAWRKTIPPTPVPKK